MPDRAKRWRLRHARLRRPRLRARDMSRPRPQVSVAIPVFNGERYIGEAVRSVLAQTLHDIEVIVVDDASTDRTVEILAGIADPRLQVVAGPKRGASGAANEAIARCRADLVARLDADDVMEPQRLERQVAWLASRPGLGGGASYYWLIDEAGRICGWGDPPLLELADLDRQLSHGGRLIYAHPTVTLRRAALEKVGGYDPRFDSCEDVELLLRMYEAGHPVLVQPERLTRFRVHGGSVSATEGERQYFLDRAIFGNFQRRRQGLPELSPDAYVAHAQATLPRRVMTRARIRARRLHRAYGVARMQRRPLAAAAALAGAALLDVDAAWGAIRRRFGRRLGHRAPGGQGDAEV
jgi:glycosyltransferase involved in cell wall biosynthesis